MLVCANNRIKEKEVTIAWQDVKRMAEEVGVTGRRHGIFAAADFKEILSKKK